MVATIRPLAEDDEFTTTNLEEFMADRGVFVRWYRIRDHLLEAIGVPWNEVKRGRITSSDAHAVASGLFAVLFDMSGMTYRQLARECGVSRELIRLWIDGTCTPHIETVGILRQECDKHYGEAMQKIEDIKASSKELEDTIKRSYSKRMVVEAEEGEARVN